MFAERIREYWPAVTASNLIADYCGIRPKIMMNGVMYDDFYIGVSYLSIEFPCLATNLSVG